MSLPSKSVYCQDEKLQPAVYNKQPSLFSPARLPLRPYCTNDLSTGLVIRPVATALNYKYIQPNPPCIVYYLVFDIDREGAVFAHEDHNVATPNFVVINPDNGHGHAIYGLSIPVTTSEASHIKPVQYAEAIERGYLEALGADRGYSGLICKNPHHAAWKLWEGHPDTYSLGDLADYLDMEAIKKLSWPDNRSETYGLGRNVDLFDRLRKWSYKHVRTAKETGTLGSWFNLTINKAMTLNDYVNPLPISEITATAKSVSKWTWNRYTGGGVQGYTKQIARAKRGRELHIMRSQQSIFDVLGHWED